ncbi:fused response regulator/thioredoxin-disulfide reductase [Dictyobacter alpinus]|uniref:Fused response regulator/thioredoxin-disulfide reductase n=1 Tax=Dictyobacter alpinus TaxID=2014873 RepID=A0A402BIH5_9CHLR|nr:FAD-dependent oxidoreductase [Dictyobacter alpinus]GCE31211.1 fused response regulator/thioredoxin-disulfide reductase [Dictyobacter alpinus]
MPKPTIVVVDDSPTVLHQLEHDLQRKYRDRFRIFEATSCQQAINQLQQMNVQNELVAAFLVDAQMPEMQGSDFLKVARALYPKAKCILLTTYEDSRATIQAINTSLIDYYIMKPWEPPEIHLYPALDDLLADWQAFYETSLIQLRLVGHRWSPQMHEIGDFLARNRIPYQWLYIENSSEANQVLAQLNLSQKNLPVVVCPDGSYLIRPSLVQLAEKIHLKTHAEQPFYDLIIIGSGPAGLAAGVYGASEGLHTLLIEQEASGGQAGTSSRIENYLGFPTGLSGNDLACRAVIQAKRFGAEIITPQKATKVRLDGQYRCVELSDGTELRCHVLVLACGVSYRRLDVSGIEHLTGKGVYYGGSITEAMACIDENVYIVGGANSAGQAAIYFAKYARHVTMLVRADSLAKDMSRYLIDQIASTNNIEVKTSTRVIAVQGKQHLESITIINDITQEGQTLPATALFIYIGAEPHTSWLKSVVQMDEKGFIVTGSDLVHEGQVPKGWLLNREPFHLETSVPGTFAVGDVRHGSVKRIAASVGEGSMAVMFVHRYLENSALRA